jgi:hypothetical protein
MPFKDPEQGRRYRKAYNKDYRKRVSHVIEKFRKNGCKKCKEKDKDCLCAHHRDPKKKKFGIGSIASIRPALSVLAEELKKCICLCLNCHAKLHGRKRRREKRSNKEF